MGLQKSSAFPRGPERKLTPEQEAEVAAIYHSGEVRPKALRERFGICKQTLYNILARTALTQSGPPGDTGRA